MIVHTAAKSGRYLYGIVSSSGALREHPGGDYGAIGIDDGIVYYISEGELAAVVSDVPNEKIRPERRNLAAYQGVLRRLMEEGTMLPMTFGTVAESPEATRKILSDHQELFAGLLKRVAGKFEMTLKVSWDVPNIFEYMVSAHAGALRTLRDRLFRDGRVPSYGEKIQLGQLFYGIVDTERAAHTRTVVRILSPRCVEIKECPLRDEREIMNLACLVGRDARDKFEQAVCEVAKLFDEKDFLFDYGGPLPPYNFAEMNIEI